jgi:hypothetical protein
MSSSSRPDLPAEEGSDASTYPPVLDPAFVLRRAQVPPCVQQLQTYLPAKEGCSTTTCPAALGGLQASSIKKGIAGTIVQLGTRVPKAHECSQSVCRFSRHTPMTVL